MTKNAPLYFDTIEAAQAYQARLQTAPAQESAPIYFDTIEAAQAYQARLQVTQAARSDGADTDVGTITQESPTYDSMATATGKALRNVPERLEQSMGGLVRMLGEDMSADKARYVRDRARQAGLSVEDYMLITDAVRSGKIDKIDNVQDTLAALKAEGYGGRQGMDLPEKIADFGAYMGERAQESMIPVSAEPDSAAYYVSSAIGSLAELVPALAASIVTRKPSPALAVMSAQVGGQSYAKARESGASVEEAQRYATGSVAAEVIPSAVPLAVVLQRGRSFVAKALGATAAEAAQETLTEAINIGLDQGILDESITWGEGGEARQRLKDAAIIGGLVGGGMATGVAGVDAAENAYSARNPGRQFAAAMQGNIDQSVASQLSSQIKARFGDPLIQQPEHQASAPGLRPMSELVDEAIARRKPRPPAQISYGDNAMAASVPAMADKPAAVDSLKTGVDVDALLNPKPDPAPENLKFSALETVYPRLDELTLSQDVPQFKSGADESGVTEKLGGRFDPTGVGPIQVWVREDGRKEVITGRHRLDLARRSGEKTIPAQYHYESDGFDARQAATMDALLNIREGQGKVKDYVQFIQGSELSKEEADAQGILARSTGQRAYTIATQGSDALIAAHANDTISDAAAERIAKAAPNNDAHQAVGIKALNDGKSIAMAENLVKAVSYLEQDGSGGSGDLFGFDDSAIIEAERMAKRAAAIQSDIGKRINAVRGAAKNPKAAAELGVKVNDPDGLRKKIEELQATRAAWDNWPTNPELVKRLRDETTPAQHALFTPAPPAPSIVQPAEPDLFSQPVKQEAKPAQSSDPAAAQRQINAIREGEIILQSGKNSTGKKMTEAALAGVRRSVENSRRKLEAIPPAKPKAKEAAPKDKPKPQTPRKKSVKAQLDEHQKAIEAGLVEAEKIGLDIGKGDITQGDATPLQHAIIVRAYIERMLEAYKRLKPHAETATAAATLRTAMRRKRVSYALKASRTLEDIDDEILPKSELKREKDADELANALTDEWIEKLEAKLKEENNPPPVKRTERRPGYPAFHGETAELDTRIDELEKELATLGIIVSRDDVNYERAEQAYRNISFRSERRGLSEQGSYLSALKGLHDQFIKLATTDEKKARLLSEIHRYAKGYIKHNDAVLAAKSRTMSSMITGPARFPTANNQKKLDTEARRVNEMTAWDKKARKAIKKALTPELQPISSTDSNALEKLTKKLESAEAGHKIMVTANKIVRSKKMTDDAKIKAMVEAGLSEKNAKELLKPDYMGRVGFAPYNLSNSNAEIKRLKGRIAELTQRAAIAETVESGFVSIPFEGGTVEVDYDGGYVRVQHDSKPDKAVRDALKKAGLRWAPSQGAWRRKLTRSALDSVRQATGADIDSLALMRGETKPTPTTLNQLERGTLNANADNNTPPYRRAGMPERLETITLDGKRHKIPTEQRPEEIHHAVVKLIGRRTYYRHIRGRDRAGTYGIASGVVRVKAKNNIETLAHEMAHYLDMYSNREGLPNFSDSYRSREFRDEIISLAYEGIADSDVGLQMIEGFAEFVRLYLTNDRAAQSTAPKFYAEFERLLRTEPKLHKRLKRLRVMMHAFYYQGFIGRNEAGIGHKTKLGQKFDEWVYRRASRIRQKTLDSAHAYYKAELELNKRIGDAETSAWKQIRLSHGYREVADHFMNFGTLNWGANGELVVTGKSLREVFMPLNGVKLSPEHKRLAKDKVHLLMQYFKARRAIELHSQGRERQMNLGDAKKTVALHDVYPEFERIFADYQAFNKRMMDFYEDSGLVSAETRAIIEEMNKNYVPFHRIREYLGGAKAPAGGVTKRLVGGTANTEDILINIQDGIVENVRAAMLNQSKRTFYRMISSSQDGAIWASRIPPGSELIRVDEREMTRKVRQAMINAGVFDPNVDEDPTINMTPDMLQFWRHGQAPSVGDSGNIIDSVLVDGQVRYYEIRDPLLTEALQAMDPAQLSAILKVLHGIKNVFTRTVTLGLEFMGANFVMDSTSGWTFSKTKPIKGFKPFISSAMGVYHYLRQDEHYQAFIRQGGGGSHLTAVTRHGRSRRAVSVHGFSHMSIPDHILATIDRLGAASEYGTRIAEAKILRAEGANPRDAAFAGRQISTDYNVIGGSTFLANFYRSIHFFNAALQSMDRLYLELKTQRKGGNVLNFVARSVLGVMIPTIMLYLHNRDDEAYQEEPAHKRLKNWYIPIGQHPNGKTKYFTIPRPYDAGHLFGSLPEILVEKMIFDSDDDRAVYDFWWVMGNMFSLDPTPSVLLGLNDIYRNKDWRGAPVINAQYQGVEDVDQFDARTSETFYKLGQAVGWSPMKMEHMFKSSTGYLGGYFLKVMDHMLWDEAKSGEKITPQWESNPAITRFFTPQVRSYIRETQEFFDLKQEADKLVRSFALNTKADRVLSNRIGKPDFEDDAFVKQSGPLMLGLTKEEKQVLFGLHKAFGKVTKALYGSKGLKTVELEILHNQDLTGDQKRERIDALWLSRNKALKSFVMDARASLTEAKRVAAKRIESDLKASTTARFGNPLIKPQQKAEQ